MASIKTNQDVRKAVSDAGLKLWQVAMHYGVNDGNFSRKLRLELPPEEKQKIFAIIEKLKEG